MQDRIIPITRSSMPPYEEYIQAIKPLWDSHWLTNMGLYHRELEKQLREYLQVQEISLLVNGHMALELTIQAFDFPAGAEIITTPFTFVSTTHAIVRNNHVPVFCDIKESDGTMDENKIEQLITEKTVAIVPVHVYGNICNVEAIDKIAQKHGLKVIYDAAHAFGEKYNGVAVGNFGDASVFSFHATKVFNTIEGGAVTFANHELYERLYNLKNFGIRGEELVVDVGANAKMNEFAAIMGLCNLKYIDDDVRKRKKKYELYERLLGDVQGIYRMEKTSYISYNYCYYPIRIDAQIFGRDRDFVYKSLREHNILGRKYFYPLTCNAECFKKYGYNKRVEIAEEIANSILTLPLYADLEEDVIIQIVDLIKGLGNIL